MTISDISDYISDGDWRPAFTDSTIAEGSRLSRAKLVKQVEGEIIPETGDAEIRAVVFEKDGSRENPVLVLWREENLLQVEGDCSCQVKLNCAHAAAVFEYLTKGKGARVRAAFGESPAAEASIDRQSEIQSAAELFSEPPKQDPEEPTFILRVERRPADDALSWLPDVFAKAFAKYGDTQVALASGSSFGAVRTSAGDLPRNSGLESRAVGQLDKMGLIPGAEEPPLSLKRIEVPDFGSRLWRPEPKAFAEPRLFWQKFWVEWGPALEKAGWEIQYAPDIQIKPLQFRTENWKAEIVEEGKGWFHLSAGFEINGEKFELQPILAALVRNRFLENTAKKPPGQEFVVFLPDGRGIAVPIGRFRKILIALGELLDFKFNDGPLRLSKLDAAAVSDWWDSESTRVLSRAARGQTARAESRAPVLAGQERVRSPSFS